MALTTLAVFLAGKPKYVLAVAIVISILFIVIMIGISFVVKGVVKSKQLAMFNFLEWIFQDVRISPMP